MRYAAISDGIVTNVERWDEIPPPELKLVLLSDAREAGPGWTANEDDTFSPPAGSITGPLELTRRDIRERSLRDVSHTVNGREMKVRPQDISRIRNAIEIMESRGTPNIRWVMDDGRRHPVTADDLRSALNTGLSSELDIWDEFESDLPDA